MVARIKLRRLISLQITAAWLDSFATISNNLALAVFQSNGKLFAQAGDWEADDLAALSAELSAEQSPAKKSPYRIHALRMGEQVAGYLVFRSEGEQAEEVIEKTVLDGLQHLINEGTEKMSLADETLDRYREVNLLYRMGETIGATLDSEAIAKLILEESLKIVKADLGIVIFFDGEEWTPVATQGEGELSDLVSHIITHYQEKKRPEIITDIPEKISEFSTLLWSPLAVTDKILGGVLLGRKGEGEVFVAGEAKLLRTLSHQAAAALNNAQLFEDIQLYAEHLKELNAISKNISSSLDVDTVLERIVSSAIGLLRTDRGSLFLVEGAERDLVFRVTPNDSKDLIGKRLPAGTGIVGRAADSGEAQVVNDVSSEEDWFEGIDTLTEKTTEALIAVPLMIKDECVGVVELINKLDGTSFREQDITLLEAFAGEAVIALENARLHQSELVKQRMEQELQLGFEMQSSLIPTDIPQLEGWDFTAFWQPAREVSGDFYDFIPLEEQLGVVIADVADKGVHAALFMALSRSIVRASVTALHQPAESLNRANHLIAEDSTRGMFVTLFYAQFDPGGGMTYVNAGHNPPLWYQKEHSKFEECEPTGIFMGFDAGIPLEQESVSFALGDFIVLFTDGVSEAMNAKGEEFGEDRLKDILLRHREESAEKMRDALLDAIRAFVTDTKQSDDITLVIAKRH